MQLSEEQIIALAPDASSLKSGRELAVTAKWKLKECSDKALWGECQGSGKLPYQTQVDLHAIAFKCTCPSRKFPCKHGLGLLLLYARDKGSFKNTAEPDWVNDWLNKRIEKAEKKTEKADKPIDAEAQLKRAEARQKKIAGGVDDLQMWLKDLVRNGLLGIPERAYEFWQNPAKRMVDAQAPGLASMVKGLGKINYFGEQWQSELLSKMVRIHLVTEGYKNIESLTEEMQEEVRSWIGFTQSKEDLLAQPGVKDQWLILSKTFEQDDQLTVERVWLYGNTCKRFALLLQFYGYGQLPESNFLPGTAFNAELVFYKGINSQRALIKFHQGATEQAAPGFLANFQEVFEKFNDTIWANPFVEKHPMLIQQVNFVKQDHQGILMDEQGFGVNIVNHPERDLLMLALTGGKPCNVFVLGNESAFEPVSVWVNNQFYQIANAAQG